MTSTPEKVGPLAGSQAVPPKAIAAVMAAALVLFAPSVFSLSVQSTDLSAIRILEGEVLYRDLWTMYAPGSIYLMALAYAVFGVHMIVGNALGIGVSAGAVGALYHLARRVAGPKAAGLSALFFACTFLGAGYQNSLASYPPAILLIFLGLERLAAHAETGARRHVVQAGLSLGAAALFKHDIAAYACIAGALGVFAVRNDGWKQATAVVAGLAAIVVAMVSVVVAAFVAVGAGPAMVHDFLFFPTTYFPVVRPEGFRILPPIGGRPQAYWWWLTLNGPAVAALLGLPGIARSWPAAGASARRVIAMAIPAFVIFWLAAHVQANTHRITMGGLGAVLAAAGLTRFGDLGSIGSRRARTWAVILVVAWGAAVAGPRLALIARATLAGELVRLPGLEGIVATEAQARELRELARAIEEAAPPEAPILQVSWRNDVLVFAGAVPYWLTQRRMITPYHELHPGITDVEHGQRRMLEALSASPMLPVLVREHRFGADVLDYWGEQYRAGGVPVGAKLLDDWVESNYTSGRRIGMYEVMQPRRPGPNPE